MVVLSDYSFELIQENSHFILQRGHATLGPGSILIRSPGGEHPSPTHIKWLEHEWALAAQLEEIWAIVPLELTRQGGRAVLVMKDPGGQPLDVVMCQKMDIRDFLQIAVPAAAALSGMHRKGLVHKDIKPANIFVDAVGGVRLTGFGLASTSSRERQAALPLEVIAGTFAYMAPEQTGRMNRSMDARSDLYSLGVTFYEMVTGHLPFSAEDPLEWVHCHTALQPMPPNARAGVPEPVSAIIMKLLAKTADERYQTARGLEADLRQCQSQWNLHGVLDGLPLGANDVSDQLLISERLYGREAEIALLLSAFDRVVGSGIPELVLVSGYSGVGKSSVVNELHKVLVPPRGLFVSGKFDQYKRDIPYATLAQAFQSLVRQILGKSETELKHWRESLREALGPNGQIAVNLIPELEIIIGPQPPLVELSAQDAANRFRIVFRRFLGVFARPEHPLALFLDDLHWLDSATLQLLHYLMVEPEVRHVLFVGAYRDNEVTGAHPLLQTIDGIRQAGTKVQDLILSPLSLADIGQLVEGTLHCKPGAAASLTRLVYDKTGGNPFFVVQFITELAEKKLIAFDHAAASWRWDIGNIQNQGFTDNVVDLMAEKLDRLPDQAQLALQRLACLGNTADVATLAMAQEQPEQAVHDALWGAVQAGLVLRDASTYRFPHDRVQEAAYGMIPENERAAAHLKIGRRLVTTIGLDEQKEKIFEIVNQYDRGVELIATQTEKDSVAALFFIAAQQARSSAAYRSALNYLTIGRTLLGNYSWERQYDLTFALELNIAECEFIAGNNEAAEQRAAELTRVGRTKVDLAAAYRILISLQFTASRVNQAIDTALECLRLFGIDLKHGPSSDEVSAALTDIQDRLTRRSIESLIDLPLTINPDIEAAMSVLSAVWPAATGADTPLFHLIICQMVRLTLESGMTAASSQAFALYGTLPGHLSFGDFRDGYKSGCLARGIVEKHKFIAYEGQVLHLLGTIGLWSQPISFAVDTFRAGELASMKIGDIASAGNAIFRLVAHMFARGDHLDDVSQESRRSVAFLRKAGYNILLYYAICQQRLIQQLQGKTNWLGTLSGADFDEISFERDLKTNPVYVFEFWYWVVKGQARYMSGNWDEAVAAFEVAKPFRKPHSGWLEAAYYEFFSALTFCALDGGGEVDFATLKRRTDISIAKNELARWAAFCPSTFAAMEAMVSAEIARIEGKVFEAMRLYEESINLARDNGFLNYEGIAHEVAARFYMGNRLKTSGRAHLRCARDCYNRWGAHGKVRQFDELYPELRQHKDSLYSINTTDAQIEKLDILAVVKATQAISRDINLDDLVKTLLTIVVEVAGAERGLLILVHDNTASLAAEAAIAIKGQLEITLRLDEVSSFDMPMSALRYIFRTKESLILDDASRSSEFSSDEYIRTQQSKSILLLPISKQGKLSGVLYLENNLTSHAFTPERLVLLEILTSQAAISLENARLYTELQRNETFLAEGQRHTSTGTWTWNIETGEVRWSAEHFHLLGFRPGEVKPTFELWLDSVHPEDRQFVKEAVNTAVLERRPFNFEFRGISRSGEAKYFLSIGREMDRRSGSPNEYMGTLIDISERKRAKDALLNVQEDFRRLSQLISMGELAASIAHEVNQPLAAIVTNANACLRWLAEEKIDIAGARKTAQAIVSEGHRAAEIIRGIYRLSKKHPPEVKPFDINAIIRDVIALSRSELERNSVLLQTVLFEGPAIINGDGVQLRQAISNIVRNGIEAMSTVADRRRLLKISSALDADRQILVVIEDNGPGLDSAIADRIFDSFVTTKSEGMGMGLSICRTIIEAHGGELSLSKTSSEGTIFQLCLPAAAPEVFSADAA